MTQQYVPPPGHQPYYPPPAQRSNGLATAGFVVALCGAVLAVIPLLGVVAWIVAPVGIVLSIVGLARSGEVGSRGLSIWGVVLGALGLLICMLWLVGFAAATSSTAGSSYSTPQYSYFAPSYSPPTQSVPTTQAMPSVNGPFEDGTFLVGEEVAPGTYRTDGSGGSCYWERLRNTSGEFEAIIANNAVSGPSTMTVSASDGAVRFSGGCIWTRR